MKLFFTTRDMDEIFFGMQLYSDHRRSVQVQRKSLTLKYPDLLYYFCHAWEFILAEV
jgi:hypothetical protein